MTFTADTIKYCLLTWDKIEDDHIEKDAGRELTITGLYNWSKIFKGKRTFPRTAGDFDKYNLIHINFTPKNLPLMSKILPKINRNKTKILLNIDFALELWSRSFQHPELLMQEIDKADYIFGVEERMCELLETTLKRKVACIPHPCPTKKLATYRTHTRKKKFGISAHRYDTNLIIPWFMINETVPREFVTCLVGGYTALDRAVHLYDEVQEYVAFENLIPYLAKMYAMLETYTLHSYGRLTIECAILGVPCVCPNIVSSGRRLFPELCFPFNDTKAAKAKIEMLINDKDFYEEVTRYGIKEAEHYSFENCRKLMLEFLNTPQ